MLENAARVELKFGRNQRKLAAKLITEVARAVTELSEVVGVLDGSNDATDYS